MGRIIEEKTAEDNCTKAILRCKKVKRKAKIVLEAQNNCVCPVCNGTSLFGIFLTHSRGCTQHDAFIAGILTAGGYSNGQHVLDVELFIPTTGISKTCNNMVLTQGRYGPTLDSVDKKPVLCGGGFGTNTNTRQTCTVFADGAWEDYATLQGYRQYHTSWVSPGGLMLMGGWSGDTTEIVPSGGGQSVQGFNLNEETS